MATVAGQTAETRPLPLRRRADLDCREQTVGGVPFWHVKDPVTLRYYQFRPEEHAVLAMLDGTVSLRDIRREFERRFAPQQLSLSQLQSFLAMLHSSGLVISEAPGQARYLLSRVRQERWQQRIQTWSSLLAIRFRGFDPQRMLDAVLPLTRPLFSTWCVSLCVLLMLAAALLATVRFDILQNRLPAFYEFFSASNLILLALTLAVTKVLHELGHAVACRHYGGECHEMGVMLLVFTPCLYCNVSDAWMLPRRRERIVISAAGMYVELVLASMALFLWWFSVPGLFNALCLNVVFICSITTVLFNGNPLLRYDGYYILSDLVEIPNMRQQAGAMVHNALSQWFFGVPLSNRRLLPETRRGLLAAWYVAATVYRVLVVWGILWFVHSLLAPYGLEPLVAVLAVMSVSGMIIIPVVRVVMLSMNPFWRRNVSWSRFWWRAAALAAAVMGAASIPLPYEVDAPAVIEPAGARSVFVQQSGRLDFAVAAGANVAADEVIGRLTSPDLQLQIVQLEGAIAKLEQQIENLAVRRVAGGTDVEAIAALQESVQQQLTERENELRQRQSDVERLILRAPIAGQVNAPREVRRIESDPATVAALTAWTGSPLDPANQGAVLDTGTEFCIVCPSSDFEAVLAVDESEVQFVTAGQSVRVLVDHLADTWIDGRVIEIAEVDLQVAPRELVEHDDFPTRVDREGRMLPVSTVYQVRVALNSEAALIPRTTARACVAATPQSAWQRFLRFARRTFRFRSL